MMQIQTMRKLPDTLHTHLLLQVALFQLPDVTLMVSVYNKRSMKRKEMIGWFSLACRSSEPAPYHRCCCSLRENCYPYIYGVNIFDHLRRMIVC